MRCCLLTQVALHFAAEKGHVGCVKRLLQHKAVVNVSDDWGETPLIKAAAAGAELADDCRHVNVISLLLNNDAKTDMIDLHGCDALIRASRSGCVDAVRVLLKHGANPNHGARALALHEAAAFGHAWCVEALLSAGALPHIRSLHGYQPLELATHMDHANVVQCLLRFMRPLAGDAGDSAVVMAVASNAVACLSVLLEHGASPDVVDTAGVPVLHVAVELNHSRLVRLLLKYNATVNRRLYVTCSLQHTGELHDMCLALSLDYLTPVMLAVMRDRTSMLVPLVTAGASLNGVLRILSNPVVRQRLTSLVADSELERWLVERCTTPQFLQLQSALAIRTRFSPENIGRIYDLPLPRPLLDFVAFAKLDK